jgi:hypothetical protein
MLSEQPETCFVGLEFPFMLKQYQLEITFIVSAVSVDAFFFSRMKNLRKNLLLR